MPEINSSVYLISEPEQDFGPVSLKERIVGSDVVARVRLNSVSQTVEFQDYTVGETAYTRALEFSFDVLEYLKGGGGEKLVAVAYDLDTPFNTRAGAALLGEDFLSRRDTQWDVREAIVFLTDNHPSLPSTSQADRYWFGHLRFNGQDGYTIASNDLRLWLPAATPDGAVGAVDSSARLYLTEVPPDAGTGATGPAGQVGDSPSISLQQMKTRVAELESEIRTSLGVNIAVDSREYRQCIYRQYQWERQVRYETERLGGVYYYKRQGHDLESGLPSGTDVYMSMSGGFLLDEHGETPPDNFGEIWVEGRDDHLFSARYPGIISTTRPLIEGEYIFYFTGRPKALIICDAYPPEAERRRVEDVVTVTAPEGTLHEAFFDPAGIGSAVGSDADNGVLEPASFTLEGAGNVNIDRVEWESGRVEVELDPHSAGGLANHHMDFIALDGSTALRLDFDDAAEVNRDGTRAFSWNVCTQPWESGDLLMLRMSASPSDLTDATNDGPCSPPQNLAATSTHDSVTLTWDAPDDPTVTGHRILRRLNLQETFTQFDVDGATTTTYVDTSDIQPATKYIYRVHAVNAAGISDMARVAVTTLTPPPENLAATSTHDSVTLTWDAPADVAVSGYRVFRRQPGQDTFVQFDVSGATITTYVDTSDVQSSTKYIYRVHAVYPAGLSDVARVTVTTHIAP